MRWEAVKQHRILSVLTEGQDGECLVWNFCEEPAFGEVCTVFIKSHFDDESIKFALCNEIVLSSEMYFSGLSERDLELCNCSLLKCHNIQSD